MNSGLLHRHSGCALLAGWLLVVCGVWAAPGTAVESSPPSQYEVKAVWLLNFARHIDWPAKAFADPAAPIVVGVVGRDPFGPHLEAAFAGKTVKGRRIIAKRFSTDQDFTGCHIVFFSSSERKRYRELTDKLRGMPVLTVGETSEFQEEGGMVEFVRKDDTIRFRVDLEPAQHARLRASANLLKVALSVRGKYE